jgi:hypothetical protein
MSATVNRKVYVRQGDILLHGNLYLCLVGEQGGKKSTAKDFARDFFVEAFPDAPLGAAMQSREEIVKYLASDESSRSFTNEDGTLVEYHPYAFFINELKNFLSYNPAGMIEFLTDIYDRVVFDARTLKRGAELVINPSITILACETPTWIVEKLKTNIISGGFSRRMIYVYEVEDPKTVVDIAKPRPKITTDARAAQQRIRQHLIKIGRVAGEFKWTNEAERFFDNWYMENRKTLPTDSVMRGYRRTKDVQLLKVAMLVALSYPEPKLVLTIPLLEEALALLDTIEINMPKLSVAAGRNPLAVPQQKLLEIIEQAGGCLEKKIVLQRIGNEMNMMELTSVLHFLEDSGQLFRVSEPIKGSTLTKTMLASRDYISRRNVSGAGNGPLPK